MSRIAPRLTALKNSGRKALVPYIMAGDPHLDVTVHAMHALVRGGADIIELGLPFSDPFADGPTIQLAGERALRAGTHTQAVLDKIAEFRTQDNDTPIVLMGYLNPIEKFGYTAFCEAAAMAGVDGLLLVDMPPEEKELVAADVERLGLDTIFLAAPTTQDQRLEAIGQATSGYLYYVSLKGITGSGALDTAEVAARVNHLRTLTEVPIVVGFGIKTPEQAKAIAAVADGVIVGSVLVESMAKNAENPDNIPGTLEALMRDLRNSMDTLA